MTADGNPRVAALVEQVLEKDIFFVCGVPKSGTTWLEQLLDSHHEVVCKGEAHFFDFLRKQLERALIDYNRLVVREGGHTNVIAYNAADLRFLTVTAIGLMFARWAKREKVKCIGEKTPANLEVMHRIHEYLPRAKLIHIIRDGRDAAVSGWYFNINRNEPQALELYGDFSGYVVQFASIWTTQITAARKFGQSLGSQYYELRYEALLERPEDQVERLLRFLDVDRSPETVQACLAAASFEKLSKGRKKGQENPTSFYRKGVAGDWAGHFSDRDKAAFHKTAGDLLRELGYE